MRFLRALTLLLLIATGQASASTVIFASDGHKIFIGADGRESSTFGAPLGKMCKLQPEGGMIFAGLGLHRYWTNDGRTWNLDPHIREILSGSGDHETKYRQIVAASTKQLAEILAVRGTSKDNLDFYAIGGVLVWFEKGVPTYRTFQVQPIDDEHLGRLVVIQDHVDAHTIERWHVYQFPQSDYDINYAMSSPVDVVRRGLIDTAVRHKDVVGGPFAIATLDPDAIVSWAEIAESDVHPCDAR